MFKHIPFEVKLIALNGLMVLLLSLSLFYFNGTTNYDNCVQRNETRLGVRALVNNIRKYGVRSLERQIELDAIRLTAQPITCAKPFYK